MTVTGCPFACFSRTPVLAGAVEISVKVLVIAAASAWVDPVAAIEIAGLCPRRSASAAGALPAISSAAVDISFLLEGKARHLAGDRRQQPGAVYGDQRVVFRHHSGEAFKRIGLREHARSAGKLLIVEPYFPAMLLDVVLGLRIGVAFPVAIGTVIAVEVQLPVTEGINQRHRHETDRYAASDDERIALEIPLDPVLGVVEERHILARERIEYRRVALRGDQVALGDWRLYEPDVSGSWVKDDLVIRRQTALSEPVRRAIER